jgi:DNA-binding Lrp family transcriptional regulator
MNYKKPTAKDLRRVNCAEILRKSYFDGPISRLEISQQIGISPATVTNIVNGLLERKLLVESGIKRSDGGRPSTLLTICPDFGNFIGVEVGESFIHVELFDIFMNSLQTVVYPLTKPKVEPGEVIEKIAQGIQEVLKKSKLNSRQILGVGVGIPGIVDPIRGSRFIPPIGIGIMLKFSARCTRKSICQFFWITAPRPWPWAKPYSEQAAV